MHKKTVMVIFVVLNLVCLLLIDRVVEKTIRKNGIDKDVEISRVLVSSIISIERLTERLLSNALNTLEDYLVAKPNASDKELKALKDKLNVTSLITFNKEGRYLKYIKDGVVLDKRMQEKLKHMSLFEKPYSASYKDLQKQSGKVIQLPFFISATRQLFTHKNVITKSAAVWLDSLQMYLCVTFDEDYIHENFDNNLELHKGLQSISIFTPSGTPLIQSMKKGYKANDKIEEVKRYSEAPIIHDKDNLELIVPFGGIQKENGSAINKGLANSNNEYFYVLKADFSKAKLNKQILYIRTLLASIFICLSGSLYFLSRYLF